MEYECYVSDVIMDTNTGRVSMTTTVHYNILWVDKCKLQPSKCVSLCAIYCEASGSAPAVLAVAVWYDHAWVVRFHFVW